MEHHNSLRQSASILLPTLYALPSRGLPEQLQAQTEAAVEEEETGPPLGTKRQYLVVMRHGERMDEIDVSWRSTSKRPWDPPLSDKGLLQVRPRCTYTEMPRTLIWSARTDHLQNSEIKVANNFSASAGNSCSREIEGVQFWPSLHLAISKVSLRP